ncbi:methionyl-tRNA formyltransferase [Mucilaginibacter phyllosphaerae]|nr:methionyl-tRNA formyltransferase [Mucilaginibacter phyllosphaerae]
MGIYNIHYGSLPQYRGPAPVFWQLKNGEAQLGLSIHVLTDKFDAGTVVWEQSIKNEEYHNYSYINQLFSELQVRGVAEIIAKLSQKQPLLNKEQNLTHTNYYKKPQLADVIINWGKMPAKQILDLIKACTPWNNGAGTLINGFEFKILDAQLATEDNVSQTPGTIIVLDNSFKVACLNGAILNIKYFNINNTCVPARYAGFYGLKTGQIFSSEL